MFKNLLITGGAGFIGFNTAKFYLDKGYYVTVLDNFSREGTRENIKDLQNRYKKQLKVIEADIVTGVGILKKEVKNVDIIFHLASQVAVTSSIKDPMRDFKINVIGTLNILESVRNSSNNPIIIYSSTNKVYGDLPGVEILEEESRYKYVKYSNGISESQCVNFISPYGCSKGAADQYVRDYSRIYGLRTIVFRQSCIYGPYQLGVEDQGWVAWFIIALLLDKKITIFGNGKQVRDLLYVDDLIRAYDLAISNIDHTNGQIYNMGGGKNNSVSVWIELKPILERLFGRQIEVNFDKERPGDQKIYISDISKSKYDYNWVPEINIQVGLKRLFDWAQNNKKLLAIYLH